MRILIFGLVCLLGLSTTVTVRASDTPIVVNSNGFKITIDIRKDGTPVVTTVEKSARPPAAKPVKKVSAPACPKPPARVASRKHRSHAATVVVSRDLSYRRKKIVVGPPSMYSAYNASAIPPSWRPTVPDWQLLW